MKSRLIFNLLASSIFTLGFMVEGLASERACDGQKTPYETYEEFGISINSMNWERAFTYIEKSSRETIYQDTISGLIIASSIAFSDRQYETFSKILSAHGFKLDQKGRFTMGSGDTFPEIQNWPLLMKQITVYMRDDLGKPFEVEPSDLINITINNDRATGRKEGNNSDTVFFRKYPSGWCLAPK